MTTAVDTLNRKCIECGNDINHLRSDAKCCDANCRKRYNRRKDAMKRYKLNAISAIRSIEALMTDDDLESFGRAILKEIEKRTDIDTARRLADEEAQESRLATAAFLESRRNALSVTTAADTDNE